MNRFSRFVLGGVLMMSAWVFPFSALAASNCNGIYCTQNEVGPFMQGVRSECINVGNCSVDDLFTVMANVGNWILAVIGLVVLLSFIWGGIQLLTSGGSSEKVSQGKSIMKTATFGLVIVFIAYFAVTFLTCSFLSPEIKQQGFFGPDWVKNICKAR